MDNLNNMLINKEEITNIDLIKLQKMTLLYNALEKGWSIKKSGNCYVFKKKHNNEKEVYLHADRALSYGMVVDIMAILKEAGVENLGMVTDPVSGNNP